MINLCCNSTVPSSPPLSVIVVSLNPASLMVSWQPPLEINHNGPITHYVIQYTRGNKMNEITENRGFAHIISGLAASADYSVKVAAVNANGIGPFSNPVAQLSGGGSSKLGMQNAFVFIDIL